MSLRIGLLVSGERAGGSIREFHHRIGTHVLDLLGSSQRIVELGVLDLRLVLGIPEQEVSHARQCSRRR